MTARLGTACYRHRFVSLAGWLLILLAGVLSAGPVFDAMSSDGRTTATEAAHALEILEEQADAGSVVLVLIDGDPAALAEPVTAASDRAAGRDGIRAVSPPQTSKRGDAVLVSVTLARPGRDRDDTARWIDAVRQEFDQIPAQVAGSHVRYGGQRLVNEDITAEVGSELQTAELISLPLTLIVLIVVFGGLAAAAVPLIGAIATVVGSFLLMLGFSRIFDVTADAMTVVTLLGLGLSIDYGLLLVSRFREERALGHEPADAVARAWATAGRTVLFSGITVAAAIAGLLAVEDRQIRALAVAGISASVFAVLTSLTLTAVLIRLLQRRIRPRARRTAAAEDDRFFRLVRFGQRHRTVVIAGSVALLLAMAAPLLTMKARTSGLNGVPDDLPAVQVQAEIEHRFEMPTVEPTILVVAKASPAQLQAYADAWRSDDRVSALGVAEDAGNGLSTLAITVEGDQEGQRATSLLEAMRAERPTFETWFTGTAAFNVDLTSVVVGGLPIAVAIMAGTMLVLLWLMTGSVIVPIKALAMNALSLGAMLGVLTLIFQHGWLSGLLHTTTLPGMFPFTLLLVAVFGFGLSMDYEVFLLSRIKENVDAGMATDDAVAHGLRRTGGLITAAAALMVICFSGFALARMSTIEQIGLGLAIAVIIDATLVRCLLVPATMSLLGRWNWWSPVPAPRFLMESPAPGRPATPKQPAALPTSAG